MKAPLSFRIRGFCSIAALVAATAFAQTAAPPPPKLEPLPADSVTFFQGMLEGIARIESMGYGLLQKQGGPKVSAVWTTGGGAQNVAWTRLRERILKVKMHPARSSLAAYGTALLASGVVAKAFQ